MSRFVLRFTGSGDTPPADVQQIQAHPGLEVLAESNRMMLVEMPDDAVPALQGSLDGWQVSRDQLTPLPDTRPKLRG